MLKMHCILFSITLLTFIKTTEKQYGYYHSLVRHKCLNIYGINFTTTDAHNVSLLMLGASFLKSFIQYKDLKYIRIRTRNHSFA